MRFLKNLSAINDGNGFSTSELRELLEEIKKEDEGLDFVFGDNTTAMLLVSQLLDKIDPIKSGPYILKRKELGKIIPMGNSYYRRVTVTLSEQYNDFEDHDIVLDVTTVQTGQNKTGLLASGEDVCADLLDALSLFIGMPVKVV